MTAQDRALVIEAEACLVELTPLGQAYWQANFIYRATVNDAGRISELQLLELSSTSSSKRFIRLDQFEACVRRWQFTRPGAYTLLSTAGTGMSARRWTITASQDGARFRLVLPRVGDSPR